MWANRIVGACLTVLGLALLPIQIVTTFVLGILVSITFGLLLMPLSLIWAILLGPLLALSWLWSRVPLLRIPLGLFGIPLAVIGNIYVCLTPSMGEFESRFAKLALCQTFPYTLDCWSFLGGRRDLEFEYPTDFDRVVTRLCRRDPTISQYFKGLDESRKVGSE